MAAVVVFLVALAVAQAEGLREYVDADGRFRFFYPSSFGTPSRGTNDGFGDRVAAIRFSSFSATLGGEAALTSGTPAIDMQAIGGLYDAITLEIFPDDLRQRLVRALPRLTAENFCALLAQERHVDTAQPALVNLTPQQRESIAQVDRMRNADPTVISCTVDRGTVTFDKEVAFQPGMPRQHVYGAVRFLSPPYSTFQVVRAGSPPDAALLTQMTEVVRSLELR